MAERKGPSIYGIAGVKKKLKDFRRRNANEIANEMRTFKNEGVLGWFKNLGVGIFSVIMVVPNTIAAGADMLSDAVRPMSFFSTILYLILSIWGLVYSYNIDTSQMIGQDLEHVGLFILLSQSVIRLFSAFVLILVATLIITRLLDQTKSPQDKAYGIGDALANDKPFFSLVYEQYLAPLKHHMLTVLLFATIFIYFNEDLKTKLSGGITGDQWLIPYIVFVGVLRAIIEVKHSRVARIRGTKEDATLDKVGIKLGETYQLNRDYDNKPMRGPSLLLGGTLLIYNLWNGDGFGGGYSIVFNIALIVYLSFVLVEKFLVHRNDTNGDDYEWGYGSAWASIGLSSTVMVIFSAMNLAERINEDTTVEGALVAALGAVVLDVSRLGYGTRSFSVVNSEMNGLIFRVLHAIVGSIGLISVYITETDEDAKIGVIPSLRLFVVVASLVKIAGLFYSVFISKNDTALLNFINFVPMKKENVENTLRQGSTIVLLLASTVLEYNNSSDTWGWVLLIFACVARLVDCLQDSILEFGTDYMKFLKGNYENNGQLIMASGADNPRTWLVLGGLISTAYLIIQVMHYENKDYEPDSADANKLLDGTRNDFDGFIITSLVLVLAHVVLVFVSLLSNVEKLEKLKSVSFSKIPLFRQTVTTLTLVFLAVAAGQINLGYNEEGATTDSFTPTWSQLHLLAGIVIYIFTDMIGHVFL